jgi:AraC-like DNA-binding protein
MLLNQVEKHISDTQLVESNSLMYPYCYAFRTHKNIMNSHHPLDSIVKELQIKHNLETYILYDDSNNELNQIEKLKDNLMRFNLNDQSKILPISQTMDEEIDYEDVHEISGELNKLLMKKEVKEVDHWVEEFFIKIDNLSYVSVYKLRAIMSNLAYMTNRHFSMQHIDINKLFTENMEDLYNKELFCDTEFHRKWLIKFLYDILNELKHNDSDIPENLSNIMLYLQNNYNKKISLAGIAKQFYMSQSYLSRLFVKHLNMNYVEFINKIRMERAKELLEDPGNKVMNVALEVGFDSSGYFSKQFKKYYGISPKQFRKSFL